eukprot:scaffold5623_cov120-Amphora_coffeaeformis.AAC.1
MSQHNQDDYISSPWIGATTNNGCSELHEPVGMANHVAPIESVYPNHYCSSAGYNAFSYVNLLRLDIASRAEQQVENEFAFVHRRIRSAISSCSLVEVGATKICVIQYGIWYQTKLRVNLSPFLFTVSDHPRFFDQVTTRVKKPH